MTSTTTDSGNIQSSRVYALNETVSCGRMNDRVNVVVDYWVREHREL